MDMTSPGHLNLGETIDEHGERTGHDREIEASDLTTHGVIVGMTGSGKTGLSIVMLEEALLQGIPVLIIDPKGDMGNLALNFPELLPTDFEPWVNPADAKREGQSQTEYAAEVAQTWEEGLAGWGIDGSHMEQLKSSTDFTIYTPGSHAGVPLNLMGDLSATAQTNPEIVADEVEGFVSSLLGLIDISADPLTSREHILLSNLIHRAWDEGRDLDMATLLGEIQTPPMRKLGILDLETFYPAGDRAELAMRLNGLLASPSFAAWRQGAPLDIEQMFETTDSKARASIISIAHLSEAERHFVVTLVLSKVITWMRSQPGTSDLRALIYMDEVFGYVPPSAMPTPKKPILTLLKQARAYGVGMVLATQNPVDIDYKALTNAGTWIIGRLQAERDKERLLNGIGNASDDLSDMISTLDGRQFVLHQTRSDAPSLFTSRWAMSYLAGPLTRAQITQLSPEDRGEGDAPDATSNTNPQDAPQTRPAPPPAPLADDESVIAPDVAEGTRVAWVDPAAPWLESAGGSANGRHLQATIAARVSILFDETKADLSHRIEWEALINPLTDDLDATMIAEVDHDPRDLRDTPPTDDRVYILPDAKIHTKTFVRTASTRIKQHVYRNETLKLLHNAELKMFSTPDETAERFRTRCAIAADERTDEDVAKLRATLEKKQDRVKAAIDKAQDRVRELEQDVDSRGRDQILDLGMSVLGSVFGGRRSTRSILGGARRASSKNRTKANAQERLETAKNRLEDKIDQYEELETELINAMTDIQQDWEERAEAIEPFEVRLEKSDITIDELVLVWLPTER